MEGTIRVGVVTSVDAGNRTARVRFPEVDLTSGWLKVLTRPPSVAIGNTEGVSGEAGGGSTGATAGGTVEDEDKFASHSHTTSAHSHALPAHNHTATVTDWMPSVNSVVLCAFVDGFNGDGYILGAIR